MTPKKIRVEIRLPASVVRKLKAVAKREGVSVNEYVARIIWAQGKA
jgi:predicted HicB family RNase H-like nuclease